MERNESRPKRQTKQAYSDRLAQLAAAIEADYQYIYGSYLASTNRFRRDQLAAVLDRLEIARDASAAAAAIESQDDPIPAGA